MISNDLKQWLFAKGIANSRTTPYNPTGNGQVERYNGMIWKSVLLTLKSGNLSANSWERVLPDAPHSIIHCTPHERLFNFQRRSTSGHSIPSWLNSPGPVLMKRNVRQSKYDPLVDEVDFTESKRTHSMHTFVYQMVEIASIEQPLETFENSNFNESIEETNQNEIEKLCEPKTPSADQIPWFRLVK